MMENAMAMVSSCMRRLVSTSGMSSPLMRSTGCDPTFRWRSEALRSDAIFSRSLMCIALPAPGLSRPARRRPDQGRYERQPAVLVGSTALDDVEEGLLQRRGHGAALARAHRL